MKLYSCFIHEARNAKNHLSEFPELIGAWRYSDTVPQQQIWGRDKKKTFAYDTMLEAFATAEYDSGNPKPLNKMQEYTELTPIESSYMAHIDG